jgi:energy-coupling factor transport system substrate-specific component
MTWQLGAFAILSLALAAGFAWYERSRPDARVVALVATLAAFAALGRIAFAALPNVKPTTDIVLISGYALGGAPGFVVGAVAGLSSNFFFGQGPWTPWQMAAWGATGVFGAALAIITRNRIGRARLAVVCAVVGYAFAAFQDLGDWVTYSDHSLAQLGVYVGKGTGFDVVHAAGCAAFALAFGPAMSRSITRFARRLQVVWRPVSSAPLAAVAVAVAVTVGIALLGTSGAARASASPLQYLLSAQNRDGGFGSSPGVSSSELYSGWAALGLAAEGRNPADVSRTGHRLLDYIRAGVGGLSDPGSIERTILVARAAGVSPRQFGGKDLVALLNSHIRRDGSVSDQVNLTAFGMLALRAGGMPVPSTTISWLTRQQDSDGGFNFATGGGASDVDDTGAALEALAGDGGSAATARTRAVSFIRHQQNRDGGFPSQRGGPSNAQSTAWAVQGLLAAGVNPGTLRRGGPDPLSYLRSLIVADGHVRYSRASDQTPVWVTAQAAMALAGKALPLSPVRRTGHGRAHQGGGGGGGSASGGGRGGRGSRAHAKQSAAASSTRSAPLTALAGGAAVAAAVALAPVGLG